EVYVRLLPLWQTLAADFPTLPEYGSMVGLAHFNLAQVLLKRRDPASLTRCRGLLNQAVEAQLAALKVNPRNQDHRQRLAWAFDLLAETRVRLGEQGEAERPAARLTELFPEDAARYRGALARAGKRP